MMIDSQRLMETFARLLELVDENKRPAVIECAQHGYEVVKACLASGKPIEPEKGPIVRTNIPDMRRR